MDPRLVVGRKRLLLLILSLTCTCTPSNKAEFFSCPFSGRGACRRSRAAGIPARRAGSPQHAPSAFDPLPPPGCRKSGSSMRQRTLSVLDRGGKRSCSTTLPTSSNPRGLWSGGLGAPGAFRPGRSMVGQSFRRGSESVGRGGRGGRVEKKMLCSYQE